jgi:hypothetical protein
MPRAKYKSPESLIFQTGILSGSFFPGQRLIFEALPAADLEIHTGMMASAILSDTIPCSRLLMEHLEQEADPLLSQPLPETHLVGSGGLSEMADEGPEAIAAAVK